MRSLFWDTRLERVNLQRDADFILSRILEFGRARDVTWLIRRFGLERIHHFLATSGHPELSARTLCFWRAALHAEDETWLSPPAFRRSKFAYWSS